jgi:4-hydroxy-3-polyprenylbenzoate decarboxylase
MKASLARVLSLSTPLSTNVAKHSQIRFNFRENERQRRSHALIGTPVPLLSLPRVATIPVVKTITVGISGASGAIYAQRLLVQLEQSPEVRQINLVISGPGRRVITDELDITASSDTEELVSEMIGRPSNKTIVFHPGDIGATIASGSYPVDAMVIIPCSASTLGVLASGSCRNLLHRAADVCLKEGRRLVIVPRETPLSTIHLENMLKLRQAGAVIVPAMPAFYHRPANIIEMVDHFVYRVMDHLGLAHSEATVWQGERRV